MSESNPVWSAPETPNPAEILSEARRDIIEGHHDRALSQLVWFHYNSTRYDPSLNGVRLSFALGDWLELGKVYPPALVKFVERRDSIVGELDGASGKNVRRLFQEMSAFNFVLGAKDETFRVFLELEEKNPVQAKEVYPLVRRLLVERGEFDRCIHYHDVESTQYKLIECLDLVGQGFGESSPVRRAFEDYVMCEIGVGVALLSLVGMRVKAVDLARRAEGSWSSERLHAVLRDAIDGVLPGTRK